MGVRGLQAFMERCCPEACEVVNLREVTNQYILKTKITQHPLTIPESTIVVDGMACLRHWYTSKDWLCGGQWKEYMDVLKSWVETFTTAGIRLVFFFDGVVKEQKRPEWVKRRRKVNAEVSKIFHFVKKHKKQPVRDLFCLPFGLATFTCFALRTLGQEVFCTLQEADYEIASYACQHGSMGILGQDSDFLIYDRPEVAAPRLTTFLSIFDCPEYSELYGNIEDSLLAALCLLTYIVLQIKSLSQEDLDAYLSQAVCLRLKSAQKLQQIKLPFLSSRAVQLGSLYVRGLGHLLGANCASGGPLPNAALMPWHSFDGRLFHLKYLQAQSGVEKVVLLESDAFSSIQCRMMQLELAASVRLSESTIITIIQTPPGFDHIRTEGSTGWHRDGHSLLLKEHNFLMGLKGRI
ncbi:Constitutive coactivator of peroxisome proliferator-activated receptor gamma [Takifugu flavidus]|uniref:Constitutive coactivator of peroxisome proliferator-activated receptor gamma n=1 Tax=Takifugu flavidus TaxID=433684 RepID=A0A5C6NKM6_9TELE|nr:Constitutive coactivator of peroxisome proliferator-activated receptor gamma [Takifugu flavidus]